MLVEGTEEWAMGKDLVESYFLHFDISASNTHQFFIHFFSESCIIALVHTSLIEHCLQLVFLVFEKDGCCSFGMHCLDDLGVGVL